MLRWMIDICGALQELHTLRVPIIHRDIKPANIKITPENRPVLIDFGLAKLQRTGNPTMTAAQGVSPGFAPPEQYMAKGRTDGRTDLYGLGATMYACLTGKDPAEAPARLLAQTGAGTWWGCAGARAPVESTHQRGDRQDHHARAGALADAPTAGRAADARRVALCSGRSGRRARCRRHRQASRRRASEDSAKRPVAARQAQTMEQPSVKQPAAGQGQRAAKGGSKGATAAPQRGRGAGIYATSARADGPSTAIATNPDESAERQAGRGCLSKTGAQPGAGKPRASGAAARRALAEGRACSGNQGDAGDAGERPRSLLL